MRAGDLDMQWPRAGCAAQLAAFALACGLVLGSAQSQAQPASTAAPDASPGWQFKLAPYAWLPALGGTIRTPLPGLDDRSSDLGSGEVLSDLSALPIMIAAEARYGRFTLVGDFFYAALDSDIDTHDVLFRGGHARVASTIGLDLDFNGPFLALTFRL